MPGHQRRSHPLAGAQPLSQGMVRRQLPALHFWRSPGARAENVSLWEFKLQRSADASPSQMSPRASQWGKSASASDARRPRMANTLRYPSWSARGISLACGREQGVRVLRVRNRSFVPLRGRRAGANNAPACRHRHEIHRQHPDWRITVVTCEQFVTHFIRSMFEPAASTRAASAYGRVSLVLKRETPDVLLVDDIQFSATRLHTQRPQLG